MIAALISLIAAVPATLVVWSAISLRSNLAKAHAVGLPVLVRYITPTNPL